MTQSRDSKHGKRTANGLIGVGVNNESLRLNIPKSVHPSGKSTRISLGLRDSYENQIQAAEVARRLNSMLGANIPIDWDNFNQYLPWRQHLHVVKPKEDKTIGWLAKEYYETALKPTLGERSQYDYEGTCFNLIKRYSDETITTYTANKIFSDFMANPTFTRKIALSFLERAYDWGIQQSKLPPSPNPFRGMQQQIKVKKRVSVLTGLAPEYVAFTREERDLIIKTFYDEKPQLANLIYFLFHTGCRTGEACALTWDDVSPDFRQIYFTKTYSFALNKVLDGTKTDSKTGKTGRRFHCPNYFSEWLKLIEPKDVVGSDLIFPNTKGKYYQKTSIRRTWDKGYVTIDGKKHTQDGIVLRLAKEGRIHDYLPQYHTRHTFITLAIEAGLDTTLIADQCGNSDNMVNNVYRSKNRNPNWDLLS